MEWDSSVAAGSQSYMEEAEFENVNKPCQSQICASKAFRGHPRARTPDLMWLGSARVLLGVKDRIRHSERMAQLLPFLPGNSLFSLGWPSAQNFLRSKPVGTRVRIRLSRGQAGKGGKGHSCREQAASEAITREHSCPQGQSPGMLALRTQT